MEFDDDLFQVETSRVCRIDRPRWWIVGTEGGFVKSGIDPQEDALRAGDIDRAEEPEGIRGSSVEGEDGGDRRVASPRSAPLGQLLPQHRRPPRGAQPLAVTAEQAREVVRVLEAAVSSPDHAVIEGPWGSDAGRLDPERRIPGVAEGW